MEVMNNRWNSVPESIFTTMAGISNKAGAINLSQGFPDFDGPMHIKEAACRAIRDGHNQYAPSSGLIALRQRLSDYRHLRSTLSYCPNDEITIFSGATEALWVSLLGLNGPGDEVVTFAPYYDSYRPAVESAGAVLREVKLEAPDFAVDREAIEAVMSERTKMFVLNHPHNPTGRVFRPDELAIIADIAKRRDLIVITDEVYEELYFEPKSYHYFATIDDMRARTVAISSTSKTFSFTGWKIGFAFAPKELTSILRKVHQATVFCSATPLQHAMVAAFEAGEDYYSDLRTAYRIARDTLAAGLRETGQVPFIPEGTYFMLADYSQLSKKCDYDFAVWQTTAAKVSCIPVSSFFLDQELASANQLVRYAFCKDINTLQKATGRLKDFYRADEDE